MHDLNSWCVLEIKTQTPEHSSCATNIHHPLAHGQFWLWPRSRLQRLCSDKLYSQQTHHLTFVDESHVLLMCRCEAFGRVFLLWRGGSEKALRVEALKYNFWGRRATKTTNPRYKGRLFGRSYRNKYTLGASSALWSLNVNINFASNFSLIPLFHQKGSGSVSGAKFRTVQSIVTKLVPGWNRNSWFF